MEILTTNGEYSDNNNWEIYGPVTYTMNSNTMPYTQIISPFNTDCEVALTYAHSTTSNGEMIISFDVDLFPPPMTPVPGQLISPVNGHVFVGGTVDSPHYPIFHPLRTSIYIYSLATTAGVNVATFFFRRPTNVSIPVEAHKLYEDPTI